MPSFKNIQRLIRKALKEAETEILIEEPDLTEEELKSLLGLVKIRLLEEADVDVEWYQEQEQAIKEWSVSRKNKKEKEVEQKIEQAKQEVESKIPKIPEPTIINKIVKEVVKEKPITIIKPTEVRTETIIEKELDRTELEEIEQDVRTLQSTVVDLSDKVGQIKEPKEIDISSLKVEISKDTADYISGVLKDMPNWRALGMGLRGDIDKLRTDFDNFSSSENLWDRSGTTLTPLNANDSVDLGSGNFTTTGVMALGTTTDSNKQLNIYLTGARTSTHSAIDILCDTTGVVSFSKFQYGLSVNVSGTWTGGTTYGIYCNTSAGWAGYFRRLGDATNVKLAGQSSSVYAASNIVTDGNLQIREGGESPQYYTIFQGGDQAANVTYTLPTALPASIGFLKSSDAGVLSWDINTYVATDNANWTTLTNDSMADALHRHSELSASDGTPNPALSVDASGNVGIGITPTSKLHLKSADDLSATNIFQLVSNNEQVGLGFGYDTIRTYGTNADLSLNLEAKGTGRVNVINSAFGVDEYSYLGGLRIKGSDGNSIYQEADIGITNNGGNNGLILLQAGGGYFKGGNYGVGKAADYNPFEIISAVGGLDSTYANLGLWDSTAMATGVGGLLGFYGKYTSGGAYAGFASIRGGKEDGVSGNYGTYLGFNARANGGSIVEIMRVKGDGTVQIGTSASTRRFSIKEDSNSDWIEFRDGSDVAQWHISEQGAGDLDFVETGVAIGRLHLKAGGNVGIGTTSPDELFSVADLFLTTSTGDTYWVGEGSGIPYGSCYGNEIAWSQASAAQNTWYNISDTDMSDGNGGLNLIAHDGSGKLTVTKAGKYLVNYSITVESSVANDHIQSGIELDGSGSAISDGQSHMHPVADKEENLAGTAIVDLAANGTIEISVRATDTNTPTITVSHLNISATMVGGT